MAFDQRLADRRRRARPSFRSSSRSPAPAPPSAPVTPIASPGRRAVAPTSSASLSAWPTTVTATNSSLLARDVAATDRDAALARPALRRRRSARAPPARLEVLRHPEREVCLAGFRAHRREIGERGREALVPEVQDRRGPEAEVDALDERVDRRRPRRRRRGRPPHRRPSRDSTRSPAQPEPPSDLRRSARIRSPGSSVGRQSGTAITSMYAQSASVAALQPAVSARAPRAASSQIAYQGTSQAEAHEHRERRPARREDPGPRIVAPRPGSPQRDRRASSASSAAKPGAREMRRSSPREPPGERRDPVGGSLREAPARRALLVLSDQHECVERLRAEDRERRDRRSAATVATAPARNALRPLAPIRMKGADDPAGGLDRPPRRPRERAGRSRAASPRTASPASPPITTSITSASLCAPPTTCTSTSGLSPTASAANTGSRPSRRAHAHVERDDAEARERRRSPSASRTRPDTLSFASGSVASVKSGP